MTRETTSIARRVHAHLDAHPALADAIRLGIANYSAVARRVASDLEVRQPVCLRSAGAEKLHVRGPRHSARDHGSGVVIASEYERRNASPLEPSHSAGEVQSRAHVLPIAVEQVAGNKDEVHRFIDCRLN